MLNLVPSNPASTPSMPPASINAVPAKQDGSFKGVVDQVTASQIPANKPSDATPRTKKNNKDDCGEAADRNEKDKTAGPASGAVAASPLPLPLMAQPIAVRQSPGNRLAAATSPADTALQSGDLHLPHSANDFKNAAALLDGPRNTPPIRDGHIPVVENPPLKTGEAPKNGGKPSTGPEILKKPLELLRDKSLSLPPEGRLLGGSLPTSHLATNDAHNVRSQSSSSLAGAQTLGTGVGAAADAESKGSGEGSARKDSATWEAGIRPKGAAPVFSHAVTDLAAGELATPRATPDLRPDAAASQFFSSKAETLSSSGELRQGSRDGAMVQADVSSSKAVDADALSVVHSARLLQSVNQSEMRLGMHSAEFGNISIQASLNRDRMAAQISVDSRDLGKALSLHIPDMQARLGAQHGVHSRIALQGPNADFGDQGQGSRQGAHSQSGAGASGTSKRGSDVNAVDRNTQLAAGSQIALGASGPQGLAARLDLRI